MDKEKTDKEKTPDPFLSSREWLEATAKTDRPDFVPQAVEMFDSPRGAGGVVYRTTRKATQQEAAEWDDSRKRRRRARSCGRGRRRAGMAGRCIGLGVMGVGA